MERLSEMTAGVVARVDDQALMVELASVARNTAGHSGVLAHVQQNSIALDRAVSSLDAEIV